jgi:hypothetical protein
MATMAPRTLEEEAAKHFQGTAASRLREARRLGRRALELFRASMPEGTSLREARSLLEAHKHHGRRRSRVIEALRE